ncbi:MAG: PulJ/GspJ family protein [Planctomycetota bacterium]|jgi:prepilin-type N-terminal cleavage/methylation domain-containing protein
MRPPTKGFTLIELVAAMAVISVMGMTIAGVAMVLSTAHQHGEDYHECVQTGRVIMMNLQRTLRGARLVTAAQSDLVVLWEEDTDGNGQINISEVTVFRWDSGSRKLVRRRVVFPSDWSQGTRDFYDVAIPLWYVTDVSLNDLAYYFYYWGEDVTLAENIEAFALRVSPDAPLTTNVIVEMTVQQAARSLTLRSATWLRADCTDRVGMVGADYVLY